MLQHSGIVYPRLRWIGLHIFLVVFFTSCDGKHGKSFLPDIPGYDNAHRQIFVLHKQLLEISGITYNNDGTLSAINDEDGKIFHVGLSDAKPTSIQFGEKNDYEDIVLADSVYYVLESNGNLHIVPVSQPSGERMIKFLKKKKIEFESLYYDKAESKLVLLSKEQRLIEDALVAYSFDPVTETFSNDPYYVIPLKDVKRFMKDYSAECKPSAAAIHPVLNKLFVVASVGKVIMICSLKGEVESVYTMNPDLFSQPEGICFSPEGDMYISNEGLQGKATIIKYKYRPHK